MLIFDSINLEAGGINETVAVEVVKGSALPSSLPNLEQLGQTQPSFLFDWP
jgi:hypothetical protein